MSFGFSISDVISLVQIAYAAFEGAKRACGEHDELTQELSSLVMVLDNVESELSDPGSPISMARSHRRKELKTQIDSCLRHVRQMDKILTTYNALSDAERSGVSLWQKWRFGNGAVKDIAQIRLKISTYTTAINMTLNLISLGSRGEAERQLSRQGGELRGITESVNMIVARLNATSEGSIWSKYTDDDVDFWRDFRRKLVKKGYRSKIIRTHEALIRAYVGELDSRRVFNDEMRQSQFSVVADSDNEDPQLPELATDEVDLDISPQDENEASELGLEVGDPTTSSADQENIVEDGDQSSDFDHEEAEADMTQPLDDSGNYDHEDEQTWHEGENLDDGQFPPTMSEMAQRLEYLETRLLQTMSPEEEESDSATANEVVRVYKISTSPTKGRNIPLISRSCVDQPQSGNANISYTSKPQDIEHKDDPTPKENPTEDIALPLGEESPLQESDQQLKEPASEEKKLVITMEDPSGRKLSFPYSLVKTWDGMKSLIERALLNMDGTSPRVAKEEYDLINSDGAVIIPHLWEMFIEPDMFVTMKMWPPTTPPAAPASKLAPIIQSLRRATPPPPPPPPRSSISSVRPRSTTSSRKTSSQYSNHRSATSKWSLFFSPSPAPKAKSKTSKRSFPRVSYVPYTPSSYSDECTCWECHYAQRRPSAPSSLESEFKQRYGLGKNSGVYATYNHLRDFPNKPNESQKAIEWRVEPQDVAESVVEDIEDDCKVEPIFELDSREIYELE